MKSSRAQLLTPSNLRVDSRLPLEIRALSFQILPSPPTSNSSPATAPANADGYALVSHGLTRVSASVFGPREAIKTGAFSGGGGGGAAGAKAGDKATVNVEVGVAGWSERNSAGPGLRKGGKDRSAAATRFAFGRRGRPSWPLMGLHTAQKNDRAQLCDQGDVRTCPPPPPLPAQLDRHLHPSPRN